MKQVTFKNVSFCPEKFRGNTIEEFKAKLGDVFKKDTKLVYEKFVKPLGAIETKPERTTSNGVGRKGSESTGSKATGD